MDIHLENLSRLNQLSRQICAEKPAPETLEGLLQEAVNTKGYSQPILLAMAGLTGVFDGSLKYLTVILVNSALIFMAGVYLKRLVYNQIVFNVLCTFVAGSVASAPIVGGRSGCSLGGIRQAAPASPKKVGYTEKNAVDFDNVFC